MRDRVEERARAIYTLLKINMERGFELGELTHALGVGSGDVTHRALRLARQYATDEGLHLPPAVAQNGFRYMVTADPSKAIDPTLSMAMIEAGVRRRKQVGINFMAANMKEMGPAERAIAEALVTAQETARLAVQAIEAQNEEMTRTLIKVRAGIRKG